MNLHEMSMRVPQMSAVPGAEREIWYSGGLRSLHQGDVSEEVGRALGQGRQVPQVLLRHRARWPKGRPHHYDAPGGRGA